MIVLYHRGGPAPCYRPAIGLYQCQSDRYEIPADNVLKLDGTRPTRGDAMICGSCKNPIHPQWLFESPDSEAITV